MVGAIGAIVTRSRSVDAARTRGGRLRIGAGSRGLLVLALKWVSREREEDEDREREDDVRISSTSSSSSSESEATISARSSMKKDDGWLYSS